MSASATGKWGKLGGMFVLGMVFTMAVIKFSMMTVMFPVIESPYDYNTTLRKVKENIRAEGWMIPSSYDYRKLVMDAGYGDIGRIEVVELCTPKWASKLLSREDVKPMSVMLPCRFSVYETRDGKVHVAALNNSFFAKVFGGFIGSVMGPASAEEERMLERLLEEE